MFKTRMTASILIVIGAVSLLAGVLTAPARAVEGGAAALEPSPRPPWNATATPSAPTPEPTAEDGDGGGEPSEPTATPATPTPTKAPLLPSSGGSSRASYGIWLFGVGVGCVLLALALMVLEKPWSERVR